MDRYLLGSWTNDFGILNRELDISSFISKFVNETLADTVGSTGISTLIHTNIPNLYVIIQL